MDRISELPDEILSYILTTLSMKDLLKTSVLSRRWCKLWSLRRDLHFDIFHVLGSSKEQLLQTDSNSTMERCRVHLDINIDEFVKRVDQFLKKFQGTKIDSFSMSFYLNGTHNNIIDQWISFAIAKGVERINLLLFPVPYTYATPYKRCKFRFDLFSETNASTLKHMRLEHCIVCHPTNCDYIPFKNLRSLSLYCSKVDEIFIESLLSNCRWLEKLHLIYCEFRSSMPKISIHCTVFHCEDPNQYALFATLPKLKIMKLNINLMVPTSLKITQPFKHLKQLNIIFFSPLEDTAEHSEFHLLGILTLLRASPLLHKLSLMITRPKIVENQKVVKEVDICSHDRVKVIEVGGCVGNLYEIEFVMNVLRCAHKLERIVLSPYWREHDSLDWNSDPVWFQNGRQRISEKLQSENVVGREKLVLI
ncbi:putative F-box/LRR-repeat protein [Trifolium repens]|nr:putative F-box/LRR-repeat protein [Trifolium repens]